MGMSSGTLVVETGFRASGTYPPPGLATELNAATVRQVFNVQANHSFGTAEGEVDTIVVQDRSLTASGTATYDLYTGTDLLDINSGNAPFRRVRYFGVAVISGGDSSGVAIGAASSNIWVGFFSDSSDKHKIYPDGPAYQGGSPAGATVTSTTKNIKFENLSTSASVVIRIVVGGTIFAAGEFRGFYLPTLTYP